LADRARKFECQAAANDDHSPAPLLWAGRSKIPLSPGKIAGTGGNSADDFERGNYGIKRNELVSLAGLDSNRLARKTIFCFNALYLF
jgi:hypothetical protein